MAGKRTIYIIGDFIKREEKQTLAYIKEGEEEDLMDKCAT